MRSGETKKTTPGPGSVAASVTHTADNGQRRHRAAVYLSALDQQLLAEGKPTSWQEPVTIYRTRNEKKQRGDISAEDQRILREVPPHW